MHRRGKHGAKVHGITRIRVSCGWAVSPDAVWIQIDG